jgi:hypothetical protein
MNERIRELAEQAGLYVDLNGRPWPKAMSAEKCEVAYEKFAELIVQECAELCDINDKEQGDILRKHFGVEE